MNQSWLDKIPKTMIDYLENIAVAMISNSVSVNIFNLSPFFEPSTFLSTD